MAARNGTGCGVDTTVSVRSRRARRTAPSRAAGVPGHEATPVVTDEMEPIGAERVGEPEHVVDQAFDRVLLERGRACAGRVAPLVGRDRAVARVAQRLELRRATRTTSRGSRAATARASPSAGPAASAEYRYGPTVSSMDSTDSAEEADSIIRTASWPGVRTGRRGSRRRDASPAARARARRPSTPSRRPCRPRRRRAGSRGRGTAPPRRARPASVAASFAAPRTSTSQSRTSSGMASTCS